MRTLNVIVLVFFIAVALTGIAAADPEFVVPETGSDYNIPADGTPVTVLLNISGYVGTWSAGQTHTIVATTLWVDETMGGTYDDLQYRFTHGTVSSPWLTSGTPTTWIDDSDPDYVTLEIRAVNNPPVGVEYDIHVDDSWTSTSGTDMGGTTITGTMIPEFATIALPVATILGLLFFFNHRKRKKE